MNSSEYQFAYKKFHSTVMCNFLFDQTLQFYLNSNAEVYCVFLNATEAFDLIDHEQIFKTLNNNDICPLFTRLIMILYKFNNAIIQYNKSISSSFNMQTGVKQGSVLSAYLFTLYMDDLVKLLLDTQVGCFVGNKLINTLVYADDVVLIAPSVGALKILLEKCENFSKSHHVNFNSSKSSLLFFSKSRESNNCPELDIKFCGVDIPVRNEINYLGTILKNDAELHNADKCINDMKIRSNVIINEFSHIDTEAKSKLFKSQCMVFYGCELLNLDAPYIDKLLVNWRICTRKILNLSRRTHSNLLAPLLKCKNPLLIIEQRFLNFYRKLLNHSNSVIRHLINFTISNNFSNINKNLINILFKHSISYEKLLDNKSIIIKDNFEPNWKIPLLNELILARDNLIELNLNKTEIELILYDICVC